MIGPLVRPLDWRKLETFFSTAEELLIKGLVDNSWALGGPLHILPPIQFGLVDRFNESRPSACVMDVNGFWAKKVPAQIFNSIRQVILSTQALSFTVGI